MQPKTYSQSRLSRAFWAISNIIIGLVISDLIKDVAIKITIESGGQYWKFWLIIPTFMYCIITVIECNAWLNEDSLSPLSGRDFIFHIADRIIFTVSSVAIYAMVHVLKISNVSSYESSTLWLESFQFILVTFVLFNLSVFLRQLCNRKWPNTHVSNTEFDVHSGDGHGLNAVIFYGSWAIFIEFIILSMSRKISPVFACFMFTTYQIYYFFYWWNKWHSRAYREKT